ncbi:MAG: SDR family NAD(P)-dependent oxidoreductase [Phycisphaerales bacterium]|nr:SDR family NAD(P)-dependent oxidoreductase [Phycisphaerales bacterium]
MSQPIKSVIITGSNSGIGEATARRFLNSGASVVITGRNEDRLESTRKSLVDISSEDRVIAISGDVGDPETGKILVANAIKHFGRIDALVNNAGQFGLKPFLEVTNDDLDQYNHANLKGTFFTTQAVVPQMIKQQSGSIINIGTVLVNHAMAGAPISAPMTSKGGIHALTVALSSELAPHNIRINVVAPGIIRTPLIGENADDFASIHPLGRIGESDEIAQAVDYFANAEFVTGTVLEVDGGYTHAR